MPATSPQWARKNVRHEVGRSRCRSYAVVLQHLADRACRHPMPQLPQFALNAAIAPAVVLTSQADNEGRDHLPHPRPTDASGRVGPLPGDQTPMPTHQRIRGDEGGNRVQRPSPEALGLHRQSTTLIVGQPKLPATQLLFEAPVLLDQVGDNILLRPMHPAGNRQQQQLGEGASRPSSGHCRRSQVSRLAGGYGPIHFSYRTRRTYNWGYRSTPLTNLSVLNLVNGSF